LFILDEPTSGLDALSAKMLIELLQSICKGSVKRTILLTIHQPSSYLFTLFDNFMLLSEVIHLFCHDFTWLGKPSLVWKSQSRPQALHSGKTSSPKPR
jgi:ABC-type multidrug transport system ATPase subunit